MKIVFSPKFYEVYSSDPAAAPGRMEAIVNELKDYEFVEPERASEEDILLVHTRRHYEWVKSLKLFEIAMLAVRGAIKAALISFEEPAFAAIRPPGHHASPDSCWGFCYFNNVAIAVRKLQRLGKIRKAAIVDFDLHFGDGTANTFENDEDVKYFHMKDVESISEFLERVDFDVIAVSAGFDRHKEDWGNQLETEDYTEIGKIIKEYAEEKCEGRRFAVLEGGYNHKVLGKNVRAFIKGFE
ncbi:histone deacetylase superfamily [Ferroglobus placidus DSM 10642]|uniref:Histone deacetylase superfamily n=1 Tax=Ferroglobus placidus (strain DSM 10642 / AEDII12DO) TaxID=589924 RepID=D3RYS1_FERPA|nr:acetylpolyamine aminohydrolase [Ferroglobus placidus]ADC65634.1 histone deacetylase superfamily [Ferroglobus placidus DSM 10642]